MARLVGILIIGLLVAFVVAPAVSAQAVSKDGEEEQEAADPDADFAAIHEALNEYRGDNSDETYEAFTAAAHRFLDNHPDDSRHLQAQILLMQMMNIHEDWQGLLEYAQAQEEAVADNPEMHITMLGNIGRAHANLENREEAEAIVVRLRSYSVENRRQLSQAQNEALAIERILRFLPGNPAPDFSLPRVDGEGEMSLEDFEGNYVLLVFNWASCPECQSLKSQVLKPLWEKYRDEDFRLLSVGLDTAEMQREAAEEHGYEWTLLLHDADHDIVRQYGVQGVPHLVLIDLDQKFRLIGSGQNAAEGLEEALAEAFGEEE